MKYEIYFEVCNKKLKTTIEADSAPLAIKQIKDSIFFHKVSKDEPEIENPFKDIFGDLFGKFK